jgi:arylsulfatase A-like enzyme
MGSKRTRSFRNYHQPEITEADYGGSRVLLDADYKLVIDGNENIELFDLRKDRAEGMDLHVSQSELALKLQKQLRYWQTSVLQSLRAGDYP